MGCTLSSETNENEEKILASATENIGLPRHYSSVIVQLFADQAVYDRISEKQFKKVYTLLGCPTLDLNKNLTKLYEWFQDHDGYYSLRRLSAFAVLIGQGSPVTESRVLFNAYDKDCTEMLSEQEFQELLHDIWYISCKLIVDYAAMQKALVDFDLMPTYIGKCHRAKEAMFQELRDSLFSGCRFVHSGKFVQILSEFEDGAMTSASAFRRCLYRRWKQQTGKEFSWRNKLHF